MLGFVDPDGSARDALSDRERLVLVAAPDRAAETIFAGIGARDDIVEVVELDQRQDGAELLFLDDAAVLGRIVEDGDRDEITGHIGRLAADKKCVAFRSEEVTSELQSLMRISFAVIGLENKNKQKSIQ